MIDDVPVIHAPVYGEDGMRRALCGARDGMIADTHYDADCARCIIEWETDKGEVVEVIEAGPEAEIIAEQIRKMREAGGEQPAI